MGSLVKKATGLVGSVIGGVGKAAGGGGSVPNAPNLTGNSSTADALSRTATDEAQQSFNTAQAYNANAQKTLQDVTGTQLPVMSQLADTSTKNLQQYGSTFMPLQSQQVKNALAYGSDANIERMSGMARADQASAAEAARKSAADSLAAEGVDPASVHGASLDRQAAVQGAAGIAGAGTRTALQVKSDAANMVNQANQLGLQVGQLGDTGAQTGAQVGSSVVGDTNQTNQTGVGNLNAATGLLNTGVNANNSSANIASQGFQDQMAAYKAQQDQAASGGGVLGSILGSGGIGKTIGKIAGSSLGKAAIGGVMSFLAKGGAVPDGSAVPGAVDGIDHGISMARGGTVSAKGALPVAPNPMHPTDTKPALLTPHEFVIPKDVAIHKGHEFFHKMIDKSRIEMKQRQAIPHAPAVGA